MVAGHRPRAGRLRQRHFRAVELGDRDRPVERDDRRWVETEQLVVEGDDLRPVGVAYVAGRGVYGVDRCEYLVPTGATPVARRSRTRRWPSAMSAGVPGSPVLLVERDQLTAHRDPCWAPGLDEEHQCQQAGHLTVLRHEFADQASQADGFGGQVVAYGVEVGPVAR